MSEEDEDGFTKKDALAVVAVILVFAGVIGFYYFSGQSDYTIPNFSVGKSGENYTCLENEAEWRSYEDLGNITLNITDRWQHDSQGRYKHYIDEIVIGTSIKVELRENCVMERYTTDNNQTVLSVRCEK